jgi:GTP cyclohydrolase I
VVDGKLLPVLYVYDISCKQQIKISSFVLALSSLKTYSIYTLETEVDIYSACSHTAGFLCMYGKLFIAFLASSRVPSLGSCITING